MANLVCCECYTVVKRQSNRQQRCPDCAEARERAQARARRPAKPPKALRYGAPLDEIQYAVQADLVSSIEKAKERQREERELADERWRRRDRLRIS